jgi:hypothetical protein
VHASGNARRTRELDVVDPETAQTLRFPAPSHRKPFEVVTPRTSQDFPRTCACAWTEPNTEGHTADIHVALSTKIADLCIFLTLMIGE